jgi:hypothetical protein
MRKKKPTQAALQPTGVGFFLHTRLLITLKAVQNSRKVKNLFFGRSFLFVPKILKELLHKSFFPIPTSGKV